MDVGGCTIKFFKNQKWELSNANILSGRGFKNHEDMVIYAVCPNPNRMSCQSR